MTARRPLFWRGLGCLLLLVVGVVACAPGGQTTNGEELMVEIVLDKQGDTALVEYRPGTAIITVDSERGIGGMQAKLTEGEWPEAVLVRLRLTGLERLEVGYGPTTIVTGVSSTSDPGAPATLYTRDENDSVTETTALLPSQQVAITLYSETQEPPGIPLRDGYFEIALPAHFLESGEDAFTLQWIDFYR